MQVLIPIPDLDFDPSEVAISWRVLRDAGFDVRFATPSGLPGAADDIMLTGQGLDAWGRVPGLKRLTLLGAILRADLNARRAYRLLQSDASFQHPLRYADLRVADFNALLLPGGHRARGMRTYLESAPLQHFVAQFFASGKPVAAICHGVVLAARSRLEGSSRSALYGRNTTALTWAMERSAWRSTRFFGRFWDPDYYRTYREEAGEAEGARSVQAEVTAALSDPSHFIDIDGGLLRRFLKSSGLFRDAPGRSWPAHVVRDGNYLSARWPGDVHTLAERFVELLHATRRAEQAASAAVAKGQPPLASHAP